MFSLQRIFGKEDRFFELLEASAGESQASVEALARFLKNPEAVRTFDEFVLSRRKEKQLYHQITDALSTEFVTALEREDIAALSLSLHRIPKTVEKVAEHIQLCPQLLKEINVQRQIDMLGKATGLVVEIVRELRRGVSLEKTKRINDDLQKIEGEADKLVLEHLRALYSGQYDARSVIFLKDLIELLEKVFDRCRDAGNVITQIVLKNS